MDYLKYEDFLKVDIRVGTIIDAEISNGLKNPSMLLNKEQKQDKKSAEKGKVLV